MGQKTIDTQFLGIRERLPSTLKLGGRRRSGNPSNINENFDNFATRPLDLERLIWDDVEADPTGDLLRQSPMCQARVPVAPFQLKGVDK
jgi:hypothetical protein